MTKSNLPTGLNMKIIKGAGIWARGAHALVCWRVDRYDRPYLDHIETFYRTDGHQSRKDAFEAKRQIARNGYRIFLDRHIPSGFAAAIKAAGLPTIAPQDLPVLNN